jgi:reductive dehalogenase
MDRRNFLKTSGLTALAVGAASAGISGYLNAIDPVTNGGWEKEAFEDGERFDRKPFEIDHLPFNQVGTPKRVEMYADTMLRRSTLAANFDVPEGMKFADYLATIVDVDDLPNTPFSIIKDPGLIAFYQGVLDRDGNNYFAEDLRNILVVQPRLARINAETAFDFAISGAYFMAKNVYNAVNVARVSSKDSDFEGVSANRYEVKDPAAMTRLVKKIAFLFGSSICRIVEVNPIWSYEKAPDKIRGYERGEPINIPEHWKYGIIMGSPLSWETLYGSPNYSHSLEGYGQIGPYVTEMAEFVKRLGYPARENSPHARYEFIMPPHLVAAGVGEQGRMGIVVTPEFGPNFRPGMVVTNLPLVPDKPIDIGVRQFCMNCKICAEQCPSRSISFDGPKEISGRGYDGWNVNAGTCHNSWQEVPGSGGCRICLAVCPYSKPSNWLHKTARSIALRDHTGVAATSLTWMEKAFYGENTPEHYIYQDGSREYGVVKEKPWFFESKDFLVES